MLYLGIDQHARQIAISLRDENGDVIEARQVSTKPEKIPTTPTHLQSAMTKDAGVSLGKKNHTSG